ncbi:MAG: phage tail protein, partial [Betaproteobacteria bacterium]
KDCMDGLNLKIIKKSKLDALSLWLNRASVWAFGFSALLIPAIAIADPVTMAIASGAMAGGSAYAFGFGSLLAAGQLGASIAIGLGVAAMSYFSSQAAYDLGDLGSSAFASEAGNRTQMVRQPITNKRVVYGQVKVSGPILFIHTTDNENVLHLIVGLAAHEIDGYEAIFIGEDFVEFDGDITTGLRGPVDTDTKYYKSDGDHLVKIQAYLGTTGQTANSTLLSEAADLWTSNHTLNGIAYIYARLKYDQDTFPSGIPDIKAVIRGKKVFDPRSSTTSWTDNPALIMRDFLLDTKYGLGASSTEIDSTSFTSAANLADEYVNITERTGDVETVVAASNYVEVLDDTIIFRTGDRIRIATDGTLPSGLAAATDYYAIAYGTKRVKFATSHDNALAGTAVSISDAGSGTHTISRLGEPRFTSNGTVNTDEKPSATISKMLISQGATMSYVGGVFKIIEATYSTPTLTFNEDDFISGFSINPKVGRRERFNQVRGTIADPSQEWQPTDYPAVTSDAFVTLDGETISKDLSFDFCISPSMAQRLAKMFLLDARQEMLVSAKMKLTALQAEIGDIVYLENERLGWNQTTETVSSVNVSTDAITLTADTSFVTGDIVQVASTGTIPTGLSASTDYRVIKIASNQIKLATTFQRAIDLLPIDITGAGSGTITLIRPTKAFRVIDFSLVTGKEGDSPVINVDATFKAVDSSVYDYLTSEEITVNPSRTTTLPTGAGSAIPPTGLTATSGTDQLGVAGDGTVFARIKTSWTSPSSGFVQHYELDYKRKAGNGFTADDDFTTIQVSNNATSYYIGPVDSGADYEIRIRTVTLLGFKSSYATLSGTNHTVVGKTAAPPDVQDFSVARLPDGTRRFTFSESNFPVDVKAGGGVLIKFSSNLTASFDNMTQVRGIFRASPFETNEIAAGTYRFGAKMVDSTGNESANAAFIDNVVLGQPRLKDAIVYRIEQDESWDGTLGSNSWITNENTVSSTASQTWADLGASWSVLSDEWASIVNSNSPLEYTTPEIDLGADLTFTPQISVVADGTVTITVQSGSDSDGGVTGSFAASGVLESKRYLKVKVSVAGSSPHLYQLTTIVDGEILEQDYDDIDLATYTDANFNKIGTGSFQIAMTSGVATITQARVTAIQGSSAQALFATLINKTSTVNSNPAAQFLIHDSSGTATDATIDLTLRGPKAAS